MAMIDKIAGIVRVHLEERDFKMDWAGFIAMLKTVPGFDYDNTTKNWYFEGKYYERIVEWNSEYLIHHDENQMKLFEQENDGRTSDKIYR